MLKKIFKFMIVGGLGTVTNLVIFFFLADKLKFNPTISSILCFIIAGTQNFFLNFFWTFKFDKVLVFPSLILWLKFMMSSLCGLGVNLLVMNFCVYLYNWPLYVFPQGIGILAGMVINYIMSDFIVFRRKENDG